VTPIATGAQSSGNAPADRYFGRLKLSFLGINNTFRDADTRIGPGHTTDPDIVNKVDFAMESLNDWQSQFPKDTHLPRSYFLGQLTLKKIWVKKYQDKAWAYMQQLVIVYPSTYFGKTVKTELARGFTQHYYADARPCSAGGAEPTTPPIVNNGKYKIQVHPAPCIPATPAPTAPAPTSPVPSTRPGIEPVT
jgi:hypothetical protein